MRLLEHRIPPPLVAAAIATGMWAAASQPPPLPIAAGLRTPIALALAAVGVAFDLAGLVAFRRSRTTINPLRPQRASALVTGGVYRITRNPMYVGLALMLGAWAVHLGSAWGLAGPLIFVLYIDRFQIAPEERALERLFGDEFTVYAARVRRWL